MKNIVILAGILITISACNLEKTIDLNLPEFESQLVVECYLEIGKPYRAIVSESVGYFGSRDLDLPVVSGATVIISHNGVSDTLQESLFFDFTTGKIFNYGSSTIVPADFENDFQLTVIDSTGRTLTATTRLMPKVGLDSIQLLPFQDTLISLLTFHTDDPLEANFYYRTMHRTRFIQDSLKIAFLLDDEFVGNENNQIVAGGPPVYRLNDTAIITLYHITEDFYNFIETTSSAEQNNGNPFAQPGAIRSNIEGGYGIFTGLSAVQDTFYLN